MEERLKIIQGVSYPRSGHHLLCRCLLRYWNGHVDLSEKKYKDIKQPLNFEIFPNLLKNHDFNLKLKIEENKKYLIQYRKPIESIVSWYLFNIDGGKEYMKIRNVELKRESWEKFARIEINNWNRLMEKWVLIKRENILTIDYEQLVKNPFNTLSKIIFYFIPNHIIDFKLLNKVINDENIEYKNDITKFRYYNQDFYDEIMGMSIWNEVEEFDSKIVIRQSLDRRK